MFSISVELTDNGVSKVDDVVTAIFQYIGQLAWLLLSPPFPHTYIASLLLADVYEFIWGGPMSTVLLSFPLRRAAGVYGVMTRVIERNSTKR